MKSHVTEQQLIDWLFDLTDPETAAQVAEHVARCDECRVEKARLERKFTQLRVLEDDPVLNETLVRRTTEVATVSGKPRYPWWIGLAATLIVGGLLGLMFIPEEPPGPQALQEASRAVEDRTRLNSRQNSTGRVEAETRVAEESTMRGDASVAKNIASATAGTTDQLSAESDSAPFAPASAIELVTLPRRDQVQVTIYNEADLTLVREQRKLTLKPGWNWLQFMWADTKIDPTSLTLEAQQDRDKIEIQQLVFPSRLKDIGRWLIRSEINGQVPFELTYFTSGLSWRAFYMGTLSDNETRLDLKSYVRVDNRSGEDFERTQVRLVLGQVQVLDPIASLAERQYPYGRPEPTMERSLLRQDYFSDDRDSKISEKGAVLSFAKRKEIFKKRLSEYVLYTIEDTEELVDQWGKRLLSFEANDIPVESLYKYDEDRWGDQAMRFIRFKNDVLHGLGQTPMPQGQVKLFAQVDESHLTFVGDTEFKYIPVNEDVQLNLGPARYVKVNPTPMGLQTKNHVFDPNGNLTGWDEIRQWQIEVVNTRAIPIRLEIMRGFGTTAWEVSQVSETMSYKKYNIERATFTLTLAPSERRLEVYTVTTHHGTRREESTNPP